MSEPLPARGVCAVLVTYHPDGGLADRLAGLVPQVGATVLVDNGSTAPISALVKELTSAFDVTVIDNGANLGIAHALNVGVEYAIERGFSWALLMDQDSVADADMVAELLAVQTAFPDPPRLAIVGPRFRDTSGRRIEAVRIGPPGETWQEVEMVITSGSLLSLAAYAAVGPFRTDFFIDYVDEEFCLRARAAGYHIIETRRALMSHSIGTQSSHRVGRATRWTTNHSADRRYYIARNNTVLLREYGTAGRGSWRWKSITRCVRLCKRIALFEDDKWQKICAVGAGWWDGMRGHMGPRPR
jgi:rhamnosyltransferase